MGWVEHAIWWHLYPLGFVGAPIREGERSARPRLRHLLEWLDYAVELGASGLLLGPIFASRTHGYDVIDPFRIDPRLGDDEDFDLLVRECRRRGLRLVLDGVFSHVSSEHPVLQRALAEGRGSEAAAMFDIDWEAPGGPAPRVFEGHDMLARLDHGAAAAIDHVGAVLRYWLERGIDGWRLDAAYSVPTDFWAQVLPPVRAEFADAWFLGEVIHGDYTAFVAASGLDSVTQYELWKALWSSIRDRNMFELDWTLSRHNDLVSHFTPQTFVGNHDVSRIASTLGLEGAITAVAILMTVGGIPSIYAGDEQGYVGVKEERLGGDDAVRPAFPDRPELLAAWGRPILRAHQDLIGLRRRHPWLTNAKTTPIRRGNTDYAYRASAGDGHDHLDVDVELDPRPRVTIRSSSGEVLWRQP